MPPVKTTPKNLRPYIFHGVDLSWSEGDENAVGTCPFCLKERKFSVRIDSGIARCFVCAVGNSKGGINPLSFLRELWRLSFEQTKPSEYDPLARDRRLLHADTLISWELARSITGGEWLVPGYSADGKIHQVYRYVRTVDPKKGKVSHRWMATPGVHEEGKAQGVHGVHLFDKAKSKVYVHESVGNAMAMWEVMRQCRADDEGRLRFSGEHASLVSDANVIAAPGAGYFSESWLPLLAGRDVVLCYDSDKPKGPKGSRAGYDGMRRLSELASCAAEPPASIRYVRWGGDGFDPSLKDGYDVRDLLADAGDTLDLRMPALKGLLDRVTVIPDAWIAGRNGTARKNGSVEVQPIDCSDWRTLRKAWLRAMQWTPDLEYGLACMLACAISTDIPGDQLWIKVISPPSTGKTTLVEGLSTNKDYTLSKDTLTGLSSGYQPDSEGKEDFSLIPQMKSKTFIVKDADTVLQNPAMGTIFSQFRALYDRNFRSSFKNKMSRTYEEIDCTVIICGTDKIRKMDESELGERFLDVVLMHAIPADYEEDICDRVVSRLCEGADDGEDHSRLLSTAKRMTGGYLSHLRRVASERWTEVTVSEPVRRLLRDLAIFVAHIRARPGVNLGAKHSEAQNREMAPRLVGQIVKMAKCLAIVLGRDEVDATVMALVRRCALDTASGVTLEIVRVVHREGVQGCAPRMLTEEIKTHTDAKLRELLKFLGRICVVETFEWRDPLAKGVNGGVTRRYRLTERMRRLFEEVTKVG